MFQVMHGLDLIGQDGCIRVLSRGKEKEVKKCIHAAL